MPPTSPRVVIPPELAELAEEAWGTILDAYVTGDLGLVHAARAIFDRVVSTAVAVGRVQGAETALTAVHDHLGGCAATEATP